MEPELEVQVAQDVASEKTCLPHHLHSNSSISWSCRCQSRHALLVLLSSCCCHYLVNGFLRIRSLRTRLHIHIPNPSFSSLCHSCCQQLRISFHSFWIASSPHYLLPHNVFTFHTCLQTYLTQLSRIPSFHQQVLQPAWTSQQLVGVDFFWIPCRVPCDPIINGLWNSSYMCQGLNSLYGG